jgi:hypothetical protein
LPGAEDFVFGAATIAGSSLRFATAAASFAASIHLRLPSVLLKAVSASGMVDA